MQFCLVVATLETDPDGSRYCVAFTDLEEILLVDLFAYGTEITLPADLEPRCLVEEEEEEDGRSLSAIFKIKYNARSKNVYDLRGYGCGLRPYACIVFNSSDVFNSSRVQQSAAEQSAADCTCDAAVGLSLHQQRSHESDSIMTCLPTMAEQLCAGDISCLPGNCGIYVRMQEEQAQRTARYARCRRRRRRRRRHS